MDERFLHFERPTPLSSPDRGRMLAAIAVMALALFPIFMFFLAIFAAIMNPSKIAGYSEDFFGAFPGMPFYGLIPGLPLAIVHAVLLSVFARRGWDAIGVSLATGVALSVLLEIAFVGIGMPDDSPGFWDLFLLFLPFACTEGLLCAMFWRMTIRHKRHARLAAKQAADAIRTME